MSHAICFFFFLSISRIFYRILHTNLLQMWAHYWHLALFMPTGWFSYSPSIRIFALACVNPLFYMELVEL